MFSTLRHRRQIAWVLLISLWLGALAPTFARALASSRGEIPSWSQVCTQAGMAPASSSATDVAPGNGSEPNAIGKMLMEHCPFCTLQGHDLALPAAQATASDHDPRLAHCTPERFTSAAATPFVWAATHPRGPPTQA